MATVCRKNALVSTLRTVSTNFSHPPKTEVLGSIIVIMEHATSAISSTRFHRRKFVNSPTKFPLPKLSRNSRYSRAIFSWSCVLTGHGHSVCRINALLATNRTVWTHICHSSSDPLRAFNKEISKGGLDLEIEQFSWIVWYHSGKEKHHLSKGMTGRRELVARDADMRRLWNGGECRTGVPECAKIC